MIRHALGLKVRRIIIIIFGPWPFWLKAWCLFRASFPEGIGVSAADHRWLEVFSRADRWLEIGGG